MSHRLRSQRLLIGLALVGVVGLLLLIAASRLGKPALIGPGLLLFAAGTAAAGVDAIVRRFTLDRSEQRVQVQTFVGAPAVLTGLALLLLAAAFAVAGLAYLLEGQQALLRLLRARPGIALLPAGLGAGLLGGARLLGAREWRGSLRRLLANIPERLGGLALLTLGLAAVAAGAFELLAPAAFDAALTALLDPLTKAARPPVR